MLPARSTRPLSERAAPALRTVLALGTALAGVGLAVPLAAAPAAAVDSPAGLSPVVTAADGARWSIDGENMARGAGALVEYTPDYGFTTFTNQWGAEAVVEATSTPNTYRVTQVGSALEDTSTSGNHAIPADGFVLSAGPSDDPGPVAFLTDHVAVGDLVTISRPTTTDASATIDAVDPTAESNPDGAPYPGGRGPDQLVRYTSAHGSETGTNEWGAELTVENGVVTAVGVQNSTIPSDGYVLSGNGTAATFVQQNSILGARVELDGATVRIRSDVGVVLDNVASQVAAATSAVKERYDAYVDGDFTSANASLKQAADLLARARAAGGVDDQLALYYGDEAAKAARSASTTSLPSPAAEARGVWYRPVETSEQAIRATLQEMRTAGVNEVYLEVLSGGYTIYPSAVATSAGLPAVQPSFAGFDALAAWKKEADEAGIALHAWIDGLAVGNELGDGTGPIVATHPEWLARPRNAAGSTQAAPSYNGFYMLDVTDQAARTYLLDVVAEMVGKYHLAGLDLDYMRYPSDGNPDDDFDYSTDARAAFSARYGADPTTLTQAGDPALWKKWTAFVDQQENRMVADLYARVKQVQPGAVVSDAPEAGTEADKIGEWKDVLDVVIPQAYTTSLDSIHERVASVVTSMTEGQLVYTGTAGMYERWGAAVTVDQTQAAADLDRGQVVFSWGQAGEAHVAALSSGPWRSDAVSPGVHPVAATRAVIDDVRDDLASSYVPRGGITKVLALTVSVRLEAAKVLLAGTPTSARLRAADVILTSLAKDVQRQAGQGRLDDGVAARLAESLADCDAFLQYAVKRGLR